MMAAGEHLIKKGNTYYALLVVPKELRAKLKRSRFKKSLSTDSQTKADLLKLPLIAEWKRTLALAAKGKIDPMAEVRKKAVEFRVALMATDNERMDFHDQESTGADELLEAASLEARRIEDQHGVEASRTFRNIVETNITFVNDTYQPWWDQNTDAKKTKAQHESTVKAFIAWAGLEAVVRLPRAKAGEWINHLLAGGLSKRTVERYAASMSSLWRWYIARGMATENVWKGHQLSSKKVKKQNKRHALPDEALKSLLRNVYGEGYYRQLHPDLVRIALVTGMRLDSICAIKRTEIRKEQDGYWFSILADKTDAGEREVPIHSSVDHIIKRRLKDKDPEGFLFKGLIPGGVDDKRSHHVSKAYGRFRADAGVAGKGKDFHALRNTFMEWMEGHGVPESTVKLIVGHERDSMTFGHYSSGTRVDLRAAVNKLDYGAEIMRLIQANPCDA